MIQTLVSSAEGGVTSAELPEPVSVRTVQPAEPPTRSSAKIFEGGVLDVEPSTFPPAKLTDFFDCAGAGAPPESEVEVQPAVFSIIDAEMRSSSSIARPKTPSTLSVKLFSSKLFLEEIFFVKLL